MLPVALTDRSNLDVGPDASTSEKVSAPAYSKSSRLRKIVPVANMVGRAQDILSSSSIVGLEGGAAQKVIPMAPKTSSALQPLEDEEVKTISVFKFYSILPIDQKVMLFFGAMIAFACGLFMPSIALIFGAITATYDPKNTPEQVNEKMSETIKLVAIAAFTIWLLGYIYYSFMQSVAERVTMQMRSMYLRALFKQEVAFFERNNVESMPFDVGHYFALIHVGLGESFGALLQAFGTLIGSLVIAFYKAPVFTCICLPYFPVVTILFMCLGKVSKTASFMKLEANRELNTFTEEALSAISLIVSFSQEKSYVKKFHDRADVAHDIGRRADCCQSIMVGLVRIFIFGFSLYSFYLAFILAERKVHNPVSDTFYNIEEIVVVAQSIAIGIFAILGVTPNMQNLARAQIVGHKIFEVIDREPEIRCSKKEQDEVKQADNSKEASQVVLVGSDTSRVLKNADDKSIELSHRGASVANQDKPLEYQPKASSNKPFNFQQNIWFRKVHFRYPMAPKTQPDTFQGISFQIRAGVSTAIVGASGCGKSTIVQLIERFYDPTKGEIKIDDKSLKEIDLNELRDAIGYVSQDPQFIQGTVRDNFLYANRNATQDDIQRALEQASATFITKIDQGLDTQIEAASIQGLSGGQRQRLAIARALVKNPRILILDEATSALDPKCEAEVHVAIEKLAAKQREERKKLTIITITNKLDAIKTAQTLVYVKGPREVQTAHSGNADYDRIVQQLQDPKFKAQQSLEKLYLSVDFAGQSSDELSEAIDENNDFDPKAVLRSIRGGSPKKKSPKKSIKKDPGEGKTEVIPSPASKIGDLVATPEKSQAPVEAENAIEIGSAQVVDEAQLDTDVDNAEDKPEDVEPEVNCCRVMGYYRPQCLTVFQFMVSILSSVGYPVLGYLIGKLTFILMRDTDSENWSNDKNQWSIYLLALCFAIGLLSSWQKLIYNFTNENLVLDLRTLLFESLMYKHMAWYLGGKEGDERTPEAIASVLSEDVGNLGGLTTELYAQIMETVLSIGSGITLSMFCEWRITLVCLACIPFLILGGFLMSKLRNRNEMSGSNEAKTSILSDTYAESNRLLIDVIYNYRTIVSFSHDNQELILRKYDDLLTEPSSQRTCNAHIAGAAFGYSLCVRFVYIGVVFYAGAAFIKQFTLQSENVYLAILVIFSTAFGAGSAMASIPNAALAVESATRIFKILDCQSESDIREHKGKINHIAKGKIQFKNVTFRYPGRKEKVLREMNMVIPAGKKVGIIGASGCGKSSILNLLLQLYQHEDGEILIDDKPIDQYDIIKLRKQIGMVAQEPMLFNMSIKENITFGNGKAKLSKIRQAADLSDSLMFIESDFENLEEEDRLALVRKEIVDFARETHLNDLLRLNQYSDVQALLLAKLAIENADEQFHELLKERPKLFVDVVVNELCGKKLAGIKWDDLILRIEWKAGIVKYVESLSVKGAESIVDATVKFPCKFDKQIVQQTISSHAGWFSVKAIEADIKENAAEFNKRYSKVRAERLKALHDFQNQVIEELDDGFSRKCGIKGSRLTGSQKQRLCIARALVKDPKIIILDDATSSLDEDSRETVQQALDRAMEGRTSIVIANKMSTIRNCDLLFVMNHGRIIEKGTFEQLSANEDSYFNKVKQSMDL